MQNALMTTGSGPVMDLLSNPGETASAAGRMTDIGRPRPAARRISSAADLTRGQKAAIIIRLMQGDDAAPPLGGLEQRQVVSLIQAMAGLGHVTEAAILGVIAEFLAEFGSPGLRFRPGVEGALSHLEGRISDEVARHFDRQGDAGSPGDPWAEIARTGTGELIAFLRNETPQVTAIALARLPAAIAAEILSEIPADTAREVALAAVGAGRIGEKVLHNVGAAILRGLQAETDQGALPGDPLDRLAAILNFATGERREDLLDALESVDSETSERVRRIMFTFGDICDRIEVRDVPKLARAVDNQTLVTALAGARNSDKASAEFILANLSKRLAEQLSEEIRETGEVKPRDADAAMNKVIAGIRELEKTGEITLISPEE